MTEPLSTGRAKNSTSVLGFPDKTLDADDDTELHSPAATPVPEITKLDVRRKDDQNDPAKTYKSISSMVSRPLDTSESNREYMTKQEQPYGLTLTTGKFFYRPIPINPHGFSKKIVTIPTVRPAFPRSKLQRKIRTRMMIRDNKAPLENDVDLSTSKIVFSKYDE